MKGRPKMTAEEARRYLADFTARNAKAATPPAPTDEPPVLCSGDPTGQLTFLGLTRAGLAKCRCVCGTIEDFKINLVVAELLPMSRKRLQRVNLLRCKDCLAFSSAVKKAQL